MCIAIGVRYARAKRNELARTRYTRILGTREEKFARLAEIRSFANLSWTDCLPGRQALLWPVPSERWTRMPLLTDLWPWQHSGVQWKRSWPIGETQQVLIERWRDLVSSADSERAKLFKESRDRKVAHHYPSLTNNGSRLSSIDSLHSEVPPPGKGQVRLSVTGPSLGTS